MLIINISFREIYYIFYLSLYCVTQYFLGLVNNIKEKYYGISIFTKKNRRLF